MQVENTKKRSSKRIFYFDALRSLAILSVIAVHVFMATKFMVLPEFSPNTSLNWYIADFLGVCTRCGVDLFLMLAGALSLGRVWSIKPFLQKRLVRIVGPFAFWGLVLSLLFIGFSFFFPNVVHVVTSFDLNSMLNYIVNAYLANSTGFKLYWFFWMILGTYLTMPIVNKWLANSELTEAEYFLVIWLITSIFDYTIMQKFPIKLSYFTSPIGMVILGYYLRHTKRKIFDNIYLPIILMIASAAIMIFFSHMFSTPKKFFWFDRYSIFMVMEVTGIFLLFRNIGKLNININFFNNPDGIFRKSVFSIAKYSYGMYLTHQFCLSMVFLFVTAYVPGLGFKTMYAITFLGGVLLSWGIMALLNRVPYLNQIIGAK